MIIKYKNKLSSKTATIISDKAAGVCYKTVGTTFVVFKYEEDQQDYPLVMLYEEFYKTHIKI
jgi:hypothetical protein